MASRLSLLLTIALLAAAAWAHPHIPLADDGPDVRQIKPDVYVVENKDADAQADAGQDQEAEPAQDESADDKPAAGPMQKLADKNKKKTTTQPDPTADMTLHLRGAARLKLGKYEAAEKDLLQLAATKEHRAAAVIDLAELYRRTGRYPQATELLEQHQDALGQSAEWRIARAEVLADTGKYEQALKLATTVLADDAENLHARWVAGQALETLGRYDEARRNYKWVDQWVTRDRPAGAVGKTFAGLCLDRYSRLTGNPVKYGQMILQDLYQSAYEDVDREYWPARVAAGNLSLSAYKVKQAAEDYQAAIKINPKAYHAQLGFGWAMLEQYQFERVEALLKEAKQVNDADPAVWELEAALMMAQRMYEAAAEAAGKGLKTNPNHLNCLAFQTAANMRLGEDKAVADLIARAEAINPKPAEFHHIIGQMEMAARQFDSGEKHLKTAIELAPWDPNPRTTLGMLWMQTGHETEAHEILDKAFAIDKYNRRTYNTLMLLDQLVAFDRLESEHFIVKFNRSNDEILGPYFLEYLEDIYAEISRDYNVKLERKSIIEIFPEHEQFSIRVSGRSWIPTVGACTGWVVAMYSPRDMVGKKNPRTGEPMGFNWAKVLRHEFVHVVTLAATGNRIPHWYTEGLAVSQEPGPRPWDFVQALSTALRTDQLFPVGEINWGFIRPKRQNDRQLAYAQSEWMVEFIVEKYGYKAIGELLAAFNNKLTQPEAFKKVLGVGEKEFDAAFKTWARGQVTNVWQMPSDPVPKLADATKAAEKNPEDAAAHAELAVAHFYNQRDRGRMTKAEASARRALELDPRQPKALAVLGFLLAGQAQRDPAKWAEAESVLRTLSEADPTAATAPRILAKRAVAAGRFEEAALWYQRLKRAAPMDPASYAGLAAIFLTLDMTDRAIPELAELAKREQSNPTYATKLASLYQAKKDPESAAYWLNEAMRINPFDAELHEQLAVANLDAGRPAEAIRELKVAIQLQPKNAHYWARLAYIYDAQDQPRLARMAARFAVKLDEKSPAGALLRKLGDDIPATQPDGSEIGAVR